MVCALFSGRIEAKCLDIAELMTIKIAVDMYIEVSRKTHVLLIMELCSNVTADWMSNRYYRPWSLNLLGNMDCGTKQLVQVQFAVIQHQSNSMTFALAKAGISRSSFFKASW